MPIIKRVTLDMFEFSDVMSLMTNPCNLVGVAGAGLSLEFRKRAPEFIEKYKEVCRNKELRMGTVVVVETPQHPWDMLLLPTKDHFYDTSNKIDISRGLEALRDLLKTDKYKHSSIGLPMLGCGLGKQDYEVVLPLMYDYLSDIEATVFLSMSPERTEERPKYLTIVGPPDYGNTQEEQRQIDNVIDKIMNQWQSSLSDYEGIVSGGYKGLDSYICGESFNKDYTDTYVYKKTNKRPLVVQPDKVRNGAGAVLYQNNLLSEIGDDIILFKPKGFNNNRMSAMQLWIESDITKRMSENKPPRRVAVYGEKEVTITHGKLHIPVGGFDPL